MTRTETTDADVAVAVQWRTNNAYDSVLLLNGAGRVISKYNAIPSLLVDMGNIAAWAGDPVDPDLPAGDPAEYGDLIIERLADGYNSEFN